MNQQRNMSQPNHMNNQNNNLGGKNAIAKSLGFGGMQNENK